MAFGDGRGTLSGSGGSITASNTATGSVAVFTGDLIVITTAELGTANTFATTATDNLGGSYTQVQFTNSANGVACRLLYRYVSTPGTLTTVTIAATASGNDYAISVVAFEGPFTSTPLDRAVSAGADLTSPFTATIGTGTLSQANELVIYSMALTRGQTITLATSPLVMQQNVASGTANGANTVSACTGSQIVSATTSLQPSFTCASGTFNAGAQVLGTFRRGAFDTGAGSASAIATATGGGRSDVARDGSGAAVGSSTAAGSSDIGRTGAGAAVGTVAAEGLATADVYGVAASASVGSASATALVISFPPGLIARTSKVFPTASGGTTDPIDTTGATFIVAFYSQNNGATGVSVSDSYGNSWSVRATQGDSASGSGLYGFLVTSNTNTPVVGPGHTFTITGTSGFFAVHFSAWRSSTAWTDGSAGTAPGTLPHGVGSLTPTTGDLVLTSAAGNGSIPSVSSGTILGTTPTGGTTYFPTHYAYDIAPNSSVLDPIWSGTSTAAVITSLFHGTWFDGSSSLGMSSARGAASATSAKDVTGAGSSSAFSYALADPGGYALGLIAQAKSVGGASGQTTAPIDTTGSNFLLRFTIAEYNVVPGISDNYGNTWTLSSSRSDGPGNKVHTYLHYAINAIVGPNHTVTTTLSGTNKNSVHFSAWRNGTGPNVSTSDFSSSGALSPVTLATITRKDANVLGFYGGASNSNFTGIVGPSDTLAVDSGTADHFPAFSGYRRFTDTAPVSTVYTTTPNDYIAATYFSFKGLWISAPSNVDLYSSGSSTSVSNASAVASQADAGVGSATAFATAYAYSPVLTNGVGTSTANATAAGVGSSTGGTLPNTVINSVGSGAGRDFSTLASWAASLPANLVTNDNSYIAELYNDSVFNTGGGLTLSGHTTSSTRNITVRAAAGQSFRDNANVQTNALNYSQANGVAITGSAGPSTITCRDNYSTFSGLQINHADYYSGTFNSENASNVTVDNCIITQTIYAGYSPIRMSGGGSQIRNSLLINARTTGSAVSVVGGSESSGSGGPNLYFCTLVGASNAYGTPAAIKSWFGSAVAQNCAFFGCTAILGSVASPTSYTFTSCMTDVASPPSGITGSKTYANQFYNTTVASGDYRLKSGADLIDAGTADSTNGAIDIAGTTRPQGSAWDIGAWEFKVAVTADTGAGSAVGNSIAFGNGSRDAGSVGTAVGYSIAFGSVTTGQSRQGIAAAVSTAVAGGRSDAVQPGSAAAVALATGTTSTGQIRQGLSAASSAAAAGGRSDAAASGASAGTGLVTGASSAGLDVFGAGAATATGTVLASGRSDSLAQGSDTAVGTAVGTSIVTFNPLAAGAGLALAVAAAAGSTGLNRAGATTGISTATADGRSDVASQGLAAATGIVNGLADVGFSQGLSAALGTALATGRGDGVGQGASAAFGDAGATGRADAAIFGVSVGLAVSAGASSSEIHLVAAGAAAGLGDAAATGRSDVSIDGSSTGLGQVQAAQRIDVAVAGATTGTGLATGASSAGLGVSGAGATTATSDALASGRSDASTIGNAAGHADVSALADSAFAQGVAGGTALAAAFGSSDAAGLSDAAAVGEATATGRGDGIGSGATAATSNADAIGRGDGVAAGIGSAAGTVAGFVFGDGFAAGTGAAYGNANSLAEVGYTEGHAAATGTANAVGRGDGTAAGAGVALGLAAASGFGDGVAAGAAAAHGNANSIAEVGYTDGAIAAVGVAQATGRSDSRVSGLAAVLSAAAATGQGDGIGTAVSVSTSTVQSTGRSDAIPIGSITGLATATAGTRTDVRPDGNAAATGLANGSGRLDVAAAGAVLGIGFGRAVVLVVGSGVATSTVLAAGRSDARSGGVSIGLAVGDALGALDFVGVGISTAFAHAGSFSVEPGSVTKTIDLIGHLPAPISLEGQYDPEVTLKGDMPTVTELTGQKDTVISLIGIREAKVDLIGNTGE